MDKKKHGKGVLYLGDSLDVMPLFQRQVDAIVTDPPYALTNGGKGGFMGKDWDSCLPDRRIWEECLRVLKPGGFLLAFGGSRTYHRLTCAIEDAGFEIRDCIMWLFSEGFPKSGDVSKLIDKKLGAERKIIGRHPMPARNRAGKTSFMMSVSGMPENAMLTEAATPEAKQWEGWGTCLKPAFEPIVVARKPLEGTVAENVLAHGTGAMNIDACRIGVGRWPANVVLDDSKEVQDAFACYGDKGGGKASDADYRKTNNNNSSHVVTNIKSGVHFGDSGTAARFFYTSKAIAERDDYNTHPTLKPVALMKWLIQLVTPPTGIVLDPFMGSGSTLVAAQMLGIRAAGIERESEYYEIACRRMLEVSKKHFLTHGFGI